MIWGDGDSMLGSWGCLIRQVLGVWVDYLSGKNFFFWYFFLEHFCCPKCDRWNGSFLFWKFFWMHFYYPKVWQLEWKFPFFGNILTGGMEISFLGNFSGAFLLTKVWQVEWKFPFWEWLTGNFFFGKFLGTKILNFFQKRKYTDGKHLKKEIFWWETSKKGNSLMAKF